MDWKQPKEIGENHYLFQPLETKRLYLRWMTESDAPALFQIYADEDVTRFMDIDPFTEEKEAIDEITFMNGLSARQQGCRYGVFEKHTGCLIGTCGFHAWSKQSGKAEIGYDLAKLHWGKGIMPEALGVLLDFGFDRMELYRVEALVLPSASQSMSVLQKLGFTREGLLRGNGYWQGQHWDEFIFSLLRHEWSRETIK